MPRIVPSDVVKFIDRSLPEAKRRQEARVESAWSINAKDPRLHIIFSLLEQLDGAVLPDRHEEYVIFLSAKEAIKAGLTIAQSGQDISVSVIDEMGSENPVVAIRRLLEQCPDEAVPQGTTDLPFITDTDYREKLRLDLASVDRFLNEREWKAAIVLGGSIIEALLCYAIGDYFTSKSTTISALKSQGKVPSSANDDINRWVLNTYIPVAHALNIIKDSTRDACLLAKDYRNLIHPGVAIRKSQDCSRAGALSVAGALHAVIEDLTP